MFSLTLHALNHHPLLRFETVVNDPHGAGPFSDCDCPQSDFVVAPDYCHLVAALKLHHRFLGHEQRAFSRIADETDAAKLAGTKNIAWIRK